MDARAIFRAGNEQIVAIARRAPDAAASFICECDDESCLEPMELTAEQYEEVRARNGYYLVVPGHEGADSPVQQWGHYALVEQSPRGAGSEHP